METNATKANSSSTFSQTANHTTSCDLSIISSGSAKFRVPCHSRSPLGHTTLSNMDLLGRSHYGHRLCTKMNCNTLMTLVCLQTGSKMESILFIITIKNVSNSFFLFKESNSPYILRTNRSLAHVDVTATWYGHSHTCRHCNRTRIPAGIRTFRRCVVNATGICSRDPWYHSAGLGIYQISR